MAGAFVTRGDQDGFGNHVSQLYDLSGTGAGPFLPVVIVSDGAGGVLAAAGGGSGGGGTAADQTGSNASDGQATSANNQHGLAFNYVWNPATSTWDRARAGAYGPTAEGTGPALPPIYNGFKDAAGLTRGASPATPIPSIAYDQRGTGTLDATKTSGAGSFIDIPLNGTATAGLRFQGLAASGATVSYLISNDPAQTPVDTVSSLNAGTGVSSPTRNTDGSTRIAVGGHATLRIQVTTAGTGSIAISWNLSAASTIVDLRSPLPPGTNALGTVIANLGTLNGAALDTSVQQLKTALGNPFQVGGSIANTAFGISGTLPAFAATPTFKIDQSASGISNAVFALNTTYTPSGTSGTSATAIQGTTNGVPVPVAQTDGFSTNLTGSATGPLTNATYTSGAIPTLGYAALSFEVTAGGSGNGIYIEGSNSGTNWTPIALSYPGNLGGAATSTANAIATGLFFTAPVSTNFIRVRLYSYGTGPVTGTMVLKVANNVPPNTFVTPSVGTTSGNPLFNTEVGSSTGGIGPAATPAAASSQVIKSAAGNLYGLNVVSGATAGYIMLFDATAAPADGAVTPKWVLPLAANSGYSGAPSGTPIGMGFATGIVAVFSSTGPFTKTASATAFISGSAR